MIGVIATESWATPHTPVPAITGKPTTSWFPLDVLISSAAERVPLDDDTLERFRVELRWRCACGRNGFLVRLLS